MTIDDPVEREFDAAPLRWWQRRGPASAVLLGVLVVAALLTDSGGFLSTDVGGKMATMEAMDRRGDWSPDLGYWAVDLDPDGSLYPMWSTVQAGGSWVNATSLPMLYVARPLYALGGAMAVGLLPVLGTLGAALAAWSLSRRLGGDGVLAFWMVGLASPATIYALDFWEHAPALALMLWAVVFALDGSRRDGAMWQAALAGLLFGIAAAMRQEALLYGAVTGIALGLRLLGGADWSGLTIAARRGIAMAVPTFAALAANAWLEVWAIGEAPRTTRVTGTAVAVGGDPLLRLEEAVITGLSPFAQATFDNLIVAILLGVALFSLGRFADDDARCRPYEFGALAVFVLWLFDLVVNGLGFMPGLAATTPVAFLALSRLWDDADHRFVGSIAVAAMPLVWAFGYTGGAGPQWGGRYLLVSGALLLAAAPTVLTSPSARRRLHRTALIGLSITMIGALFAIERTHGNADAMRELADRDEEVLLFHSPHRSREGGALILDEQWWAVPDEESKAEAGRLLLEMGIERTAIVGGWRDGEPPHLPGWVMVGRDEVPLVGDLVLAVTELVPG